MPRQRIRSEPHEGAEEDKWLDEQLRCVFANLPTHALPGSLARLTRRCGKPVCHCAHGEGQAGCDLT